MSTDYSPGIHGVFVGINQHASSQIHELRGAARDARALAALFEDSYRGLRPRLLVDADATRARVVSAIREALTSARTDEIVIIAFSGHGTPGHALVTHDTDPGDLENTTFAMRDFADAIHASVAKAILVILDCCYSGKMPARAFAGTSRMRNFAAPSTPAILAGEGRAILAACDDDQPAWESTEHNHGFLTHAFIEVLTSLEEPTEIGQVLTRVVDRAMAAAQRSNRPQRPVKDVNTKGRLVLRPLVKGERYHTAFPDLAAVEIGHDLRDLAALDIPEAVIDAWSTRFSRLNDLQIDAVNVAGVLRGESVCVVAPTSAGKTFIAEIAAIRAARAGRGSVFLVPYKALAREHADRFTRMYGGALGMRVIRCTGDDPESAAPFLLGKFDLAVATYETFLRLVLTSPTALAKIGLVVVDEVHFIGDQERGIVVELTLSLLRRNRSQDPHLQLLLLSAVIGCSRGFEDWLGCRLLRRDHRPVPLTEGVLDRRGVYQRKNSAGAAELEQLVEVEGEVDDILIPLVTKLVREGEKVLVFRNTRRAASNGAAELARALGLPPATTTRSALPSRDPSRTTRALGEALAGGVAFHSSDLSADERRVIETAFGDPDGPVRVLVATTTVAAGVNLPADTVVIVEHEFIGPDRHAYNVAAYSNMAGRAGRAGLTRAGRAVLLAANEIEREHLFRSYVAAPAEDLSSSFSETELDDWMLQLLGQVEDTERDEVAALVENTFGGHLRQRADPEWAATLGPRVAQRLERFAEDGLVETAGSRVRLSLLGQTCAGISLSLRSALNFAARIESQWPGQLSPDQLLVALQATSEMDATLCPCGRSGVDRTWESELSLRESRFLRCGINDITAVMQRCKRARIVSDWIDGVPIETIEVRYTTRATAPVGYGHVQAIASATRDLLRSTLDLLLVAAPERAPDPIAVERHLVRLEHGIPDEQLWMLDLPVELDRGQMLALGSAGVSDRATLITLTPDRLAELVGDGTANTLGALE